MSHHDDHDDDHAHVRPDEASEADAESLAVARAALDQTRAPLPPDDAFARQADAIMAEVLASGAARAPRAEAPRERWWHRVRERLASMGRIELAAWGAMAALILAGVFIAARQLTEQAPAPLPQPGTAAPEVPVALDDDADDDTDDALALDEDDALEAPEDDALLEALGDGELGSADEETLAALSRLSADDWAPAAPGGALWAELAEPADVTGYDDLEVLSADELARLERSLSTDRILFPR